MIKFLRTARTGSTLFTFWCELQSIEITDNRKLIDYKPDPNLKYITIVRNPFYRAYHQYTYNMKSWLGKQNKNLSFLDFLNIDWNKIKKLNLIAWTHSCPITQYLGKWVNHLDTVVKLENLKKDLNNLQSKYNLKNTIKKSMKYNVEKDKTALQHLEDKNTQNKIVSIFRKDFETFNYSTEL